MVALEEVRQRCNRHPTHLHQHHIVLNQTTAQELCTTVQIPRTSRRKIAQSVFSIFLEEGIKWNAKEKELEKQACQTNKKLIRNPPMWGPFHHGKKNYWNSTKNTWIILLVSKRKLHKNLTLNNKKFSRSLCVIFLEQ